MNFSNKIFWKNTTNQSLKKKNFPVTFQLFAKSKMQNNKKRRGWLTSRKNKILFGNKNSVLFFFATRTRFLEFYVDCFYEFIIIVLD